MRRRNTSAVTPKASVPTLVDRLKKCQSLETCPTVKALLARGEKIWPAIAVGLAAPDEMTRFWTLGVLSEIPVEAAQDAIGKMLADKEIRVRAAAAYALGWNSA